MSATCHGEDADMDHITGKSGGSFGVSNHCDMSRWFEKFPRQVGNQPVCVGETGKSATSATKHVEVGDVADKSTRMSRVCRGRHGEVGIMEFGL